MEELVKYMRALVFLQLQSATGQAFRKPEVLLSRAGFTHREIGELLGKRTAAVAKAISRSRQAQEGEDHE